MSAVLGVVACFLGNTLLNLDISDAFAGGFVAGIVEGKPLDESIDMGHWLASLSIKELGPQYVHSLLTDISLHSVNHLQRHQATASSINKDSDSSLWFLQWQSRKLGALELTQFLPSQISLPEADLRADVEKRFSLLELSRA